jgi:ATP-binding cassette subfamily B protein
MKNKNILILDDSLSALDNNVAKTIKSGLKENKCTTLIISHNLMNIMDADNIIVLDKGKIIQEGNHQKLINEEGLYKDIFNLQQSLKEGDKDE